MSAIPIEHPDEDSQDDNLRYYNQSLLAESHAEVYVGEDGNAEFVDQEGWMVFLTHEADSDSVRREWSRAMQYTGSNPGLSGFLEYERILEKLPDWVIDAAERDALRPGLKLGEVIVFGGGPVQFRINPDLDD